MGYKIVLEREGRETETLYWSGSLEETVRLAKKVASERGAAKYRIIEIAGIGQEVFSESAPFDCPVA
jgi:hypothetical protein